ncbi:MAG TPA: glycosyltransferase family 39 protein [Thermoanaerobaculia bacterium]|nr:glycosyltransferase family 39 protein [Thermoanaerobaculia bacterium]
MLSADRTDPTDLTDRSDAAPPPQKAHGRDLVVLLALGCLLFLPALGRRDLWNPDEARYAEVAREMRATGEYLLPHLNGQLYTQKPPLLFWSMALASVPFGRVTETAARLPSALAAIAALLLTFRIAERLVSRRAGWLAALAFGTSSTILWQGRFGQIDMLLGSLVALAVWFWVRAWTEERPALMLGFFASAGLATIAKGPVGLLPPLFGILLFLIATKRARQIPKLRIGRGLALYAAVVLAWLVPAALRGGTSYLQQIAFKQTVTRYAEPWHHFQPPWYYLTTIPADFFPWTFLIPTALVLGWRRLAGRERDGFLFGLSWVVATLVFFSVSPAKRSVYMLTMYPGLALVLGAALDRLAAAKPEAAVPARGEKALTAPLLLLALFSLALPLALWFGGRNRPEALPLGGERFVLTLVLALLPLALGTLWAWWQARAGRVVHAAAGVAAGMAALILIASYTVIPAFDTVKSARGLSNRLLALSRPDEPYAIYPRIDSTFLFYTERFAELPVTEPELQAFARRPGKVWLLAQRDALAKLAQPLPLVEFARDPDEKAGYVLLGKAEAKP